MIPNIIIKTVFEMAEYANKMKKSMTIESFTEFIQSELNKTVLNIEDIKFKSSNNNEIKLIVLEQYLTNLIQAKACLSITLDLKIEHPEISIDLLVM